MPAPKTEKQVTNEEIAKLFVDVEAKLEGLGTTAEKVAVLEKELGGLKGFDPKAALEAIEKLKASIETVKNAVATRRSGLGNVPGVEGESFSMVKYLAAVARGGDFKGCDAEKEREIQKTCRDAAIARLQKTGQQVGDDALGGYWVPDQVVADVIGSIYATSAFVNLGGDGENRTRISVLDGLFGGVVRMPKMEGGLVTYWLGENDTATESFASAGDLKMTPHKAICLIKLTDSMMRFGGFGFEQMLRRDMQRSFAAKIDYTIPYGRGANDQPLGILGTKGIRIYSHQSGGVGTLLTDALGSSPFQADWTGKALDFDALTNMELALEEDLIVASPSRAFVTSPRALVYLKQLKVSNFSGQTTEKPYLLGLPILSDAKLRELVGEYAKTPQISSALVPGASIGAPSATGAAKATDIINGNLDEVILGRWGGFEVEDDMGKGVGFASDYRLVKLRAHFDVAVRQPRAIIVCPDALVRA